MPAKPTISHSGSNGNYTVTVGLDSELAKDSKCVVLVTATDTGFLAVDGCKDSKYANGRTTLVFANLKIDKPGEYRFCVSATRTTGEALMNETSTFTVT